MNNKRVETEAKKVLGKDVFIERRRVQMRKWRKEDAQYSTWRVVLRRRPYNGYGCCSRGNVILGRGGSPKEALQNAIDSKNERAQQEVIYKLTGRYV